MAEEVSIKLKADTSAAVKSVKDLQNTINDLSKIKKKGNANDGIINPNDVKNFKQLADQMNRIYRDFYNQLDRTQRQIEAKKRQMETMERGGMNRRSSAYQRTEREYNDLQSQRKVLENNRNRMDTRYNSGNQTTEDVERMKVGGPFFQYANRYLKRYGGVMGMVYGANKVRKFVTQGAQMDYTYENQLYPYAQQVGGYNGNYDLTRKQVASAGAVNGYTIGQSLSTLYGFTGRAGLSAGNPILAMRELQTQGRTMGLDPSMLASVEGGMAQRGAINSTGQMRQWANMITGAIDATDMAGRQGEMVQAFNSLSSENNQGLVSQTSKANSNLLAYQTLLGATGLAGFKGQAGANFLMNIDQGIKGGSPQMQLLEGLGTSTPATMAGRLGLELQMEKGLSDPKNLSRVLTNVQKLGVKFNPKVRQEYQANVLKSQFSGTTMTEWMAILGNKNLQQALEGGQTTLDQVAKGIKKEGADKFLKQYSDYKGSYVGKANQANARKEKSQQDAGQGWYHLATNVKSAFYGMPEWAQWTLGTAGSLGGGWLAGKLGGKALRGALPTVSKFMKGGGGRGLLGRLGGLFKGGAGAEAGEMGLAGGMEAAGLAADATGIGLPVGLALALGGALVSGVAFSHMGKGKGVGINSKNQKLINDMKKKYKEPSVEEMYGTGGLGMKSNTDFFKKKGKMPSAIEMTQAGLTPDQLKHLSDQDFQTQQLTQTNNATKKSLIELEQQVQNGQKQNIQKQSQVLQQMSGGSGSLIQSGGGAGGSGGGFWGNLWKGIMNLFGHGGSGGSTGVGYTVGGGSSSANASSIFKYLTGHGLTSSAAAGVMGNLMQESTLNPLAPGGGLAQWSDPKRVAALKKYAQKTGGSTSSLNTQLGFLMQELQSGKYGSVSAINSMNPTAAAAYFEKNFEIAGNPKLANRENYASNFYSQFAAAGASSNPTITHKVVVSGSINNMDSSTSTAVGQAIVQAANKHNGVPTTNYSLGIGGFA